MLKGALIVGVCAVLGVAVAGCGAESTPEAEPESQAVSEAVIGQHCHSDYECNGAERGSMMVCSNGGGPDDGTCIYGCHTDYDCPQYTQCVMGSSRWHCQYVY